MYIYVHVHCSCVSFILRVTLHCVIHHYDMCVCTCTCTCMYMYVHVCMYSTSYYNLYIELPIWSSATIGYYTTIVHRVSLSYFLSLCTITPPKSARAVIPVHAGFFRNSQHLIRTSICIAMLGETFHVGKRLHMLMRDEKEGRKKQARSNKQQCKATQHTQGSHFS